VADRGLLITTQGKTPEVTVNRSRNRRSIAVQLVNAQLSGQLVERERRINQLGIDRLTIRQNGTQVEIALDVSRRSPDWQAQVNDQGGIMLLPATEVAVEPKSAEPALRNSLPVVMPAAPSNSVMLAEQPAPGRVASNALPRTQLATIQGIELDLSGNQLLIRTDRPVVHQAQWQSGMYVVTLSPAQLANQVTGPQLSATAPLRRVRLRQVNNQTVTVLIQPAPGIQFGALNLITPQMLALEMQRPAARPVTSVVPSASLNQPLPSVVPNGRIVVAIDPGHGGGDVGAVGIGGIHEADIVLSIAQQVARILQQQGIQAILTRSSDVEIDLQPRVDTAEQAGANLFVSIHANSMGMDRPDINGTETYYYGSGAALAQTIQTSVVSGTGMQDRGIQQARFYVLRKSSMPAVLVETGFVTGSQDAAHLANSGFQNQMAMAIARGILQYIQQQAMVGSR
jgi:N-acetylmuramoyl-L-alanine amidase